MVPWHTRAISNYAAIIRAAYTADELDRARRYEAAMLPRTGPGSGRHDVRQAQCGASVLACRACAESLRPCYQHHCPAREVGVAALLAIVRPRGAVEPQQRPPG